MGMKIGRSLALASSVLLRRFSTTGLSRVLMVDEVVASVVVGRVGVLVVVVVVGRGFVALRLHGVTTPWAKRITGTVTISTTRRMNLRKRRILENGGQGVDVVGGVWVVFVAWRFFRLLNFGFRIGCVVLSKSKSRSEVEFDLCNAISRSKIFPSSWFAFPSVRLRIDIKWKP